MRRADRLFQIVQMLRTHECMTAQQLADRLGISVRTVYRDMQDLSLSGVPLLSETGVGYRLDRAYNLPPVTFTSNELEALMLGARMVQAWSDRQMAAEATLAMERIEAILPQQLKQSLEAIDILVPAFHIFSDVAEKMPTIRQAIKQKKILSIVYRRVDGEISQRDIWPLGLFYWGNVWTLVGWCELRRDYRQFRLDRIQQQQDAGKYFEPQPHQTLKHYLLQVEKEHYENHTSM